MSTRSRRKPTGTATVSDPETVPTATVVKPTRAKAKAPAAEKKKVIVTPIKKRVPPKKKPTRGPKQGTTVVSEGVSDSSQLLKDPEPSVVGPEPENDSQSRIEQLRKQLAELEANQGSRNPLKRKPFRAETEMESDPPDRRGNPAEGRSLRTINGKTDLDTFLVRLETCGRHFGLSKSEKVFHSMNALTESAEPIVKEVGLAGTQEQILELLQSRFGNRLRLEKFHADLRNRKLSRQESLQDLYLDLCRLRALTSGENSDEKFPETFLSTP